MATMRTGYKRPRRKCALAYNCSGRDQGRRCHVQARTADRSLQRPQPVTNPKRQSSGAAFAPITKYYATTRHQSFLASLGSRFTPNQSCEFIDAARGSRDSPRVETRSRIRGNFG
jgi:hypothetical protein